MSIKKVLDRISLMNENIRKECTGNPACFARKLNISKSMLYYTLNELRDLGIQIGYNKSKKTFYYKEAFELKIAFKDR